MIIISEGKHEDALVEELAKKYHARGIAREDGFAPTFWSVKDITASKEKITKENAEAFLEYYERKLEEGAISGGWDFINYADYSDYESKIITDIMIDEALFEDIIIPKLEEDGLKAYIGEHWFYFGGTEFENTEPSSIPCKVLVNEILSVLDAFKDAEETKDEYLYYYHYIKEELEKK